MAALLAPGLPGWPCLRVPLRCRFRDDFLRSRIGLGLQRSGPDAHRLVAIGRGSPKARSGRRRGTSKARLRSGLRSGLRKFERAEEWIGQVHTVASEAGRLSHHLERQQGRDSRTGPSDCTRSPATKDGRAHVSKQLRLRKYLFSANHYFTNLNPPSFCGPALDYGQEPGSPNGSQAAH